MSVFGCPPHVTPESVGLLPVAGRRCSNSEAQTVLDSASLRPDQGSGRLNKFFSQDGIVSLRSAIARQSSRMSVRTVSIPQDGEKEATIATTKSGSKEDRA